MTKSQIILLIFLSLRISAQNWDWVKKYSNCGTCIDNGSKTAMDLSGNLYVKGFCAASAGSGGATNQFSLLYKYNSQGLLLWKDTLAYDGSGTFDIYGNLFLAGGNSISKYSNNGQLVWNQIIPNRNFTKIAITPYGGIIVGGSTKTTYCTDSSAYYMLDNSGNILWNRIGDFVPQCGTLPFTCDKNGITYLLGGQYVNGTYITSVLKIDNLGICTGTTAIPQFTANASGCSIDVSNDLAMYVSQVVSPNSAGNNTYTTTLIKYDTQGNQNWVNSIMSNQGCISGIRHDSLNNVYLLASYRLNLQYQTTVLSNTLALAVIKLNSGGNVIWIKQTAGGFYGNLSGNDFWVDNNNIYITGSIQGNHQFDTISASGDSMYPDMFVAKLSQPAIVTSIPFQKKTEQVVGIYPSPTNDLFNIEYPALGKCSLSISITNSMGQRVYSENHHAFEGDYSKVFDIGKLSKGIYFVEIKTDSERTIKKIILE